MSTRSNIAILNDNGTVTAIYCHWDGGLEHNGMILSKYYSSPKKVIELISGGDLSFLVPNIIGGDWWYWDIYRTKRFTLKHLKTDIKDLEK